MSYLARLKQRFSHASPVSAPTEPTKDGFVGSVSRVPREFLQVDACLERLELLARQCPSGADPEQWQTRIGAAVAFTPAWMPIARQLGWSMADLYSLHPHAPLNRLDAMGAAYLAGMGRVTAVTAEAIALDVGPQRVLLVRRPTFHATPAWELFCAAGASL